MERIRFTRSDQDLPGRKTRRCEYCGSPILTQRGTADKSVTDLYIREGRDRPIPTLRLRERLQAVPAGSRPKRQTQRMRAWAALAWALGLSPRSSSHPLAAFGVSVWRDVQEAGRNARRKRAGRARGQVTAIGADETAVRVKGGNGYRRGHGRPEYVQACSRASEIGASDLQSPLEEAGEEAPRQDRGMGLG